MIGTACDKFPALTEKTIEYLRQLDTEKERFLAGYTLAERRWSQQRHRTTGRIAGKRVRLGTLVKLPHGSIAMLERVIRGTALVSVPDLTKLTGKQEHVVPATNLTVLPNPAAAILGRMKRGKREKPSAAKKATAIKNGRMPCRAGRNRGRPTRRSSTAPPHHP
jgi:hypothetical protein